jgi:hypothetical protein
MELGRACTWLSVVWAAMTALPLPSHAINSMLASEIEHLAPSVKSVWTCGTWGRADVEGRYRIIVGDVNSGAGQELYVQWVAQQPSESAPRVVTTVAIRELNDDHNQYEIADVRCSVKGRTTRLIVRAINEHDEAQRPRSFTIRLNADGSYRLEPPPRR